MSGRVLAIDDDEGILKIISKILTREGYEVDTSSNPETGLQMAFTGHYDLLILDVMMPQIDGYEVADRLREHDRGKNLPILLLTAKGRYDIIRDKSRYFLYGVYGFLPKPFFGRELTFKVDEILEIMRQRQQSDETAPAVVSATEPAKDPAKADTERIAAGEGESGAAEQPAAATTPGEPN